MKYLMFFFIIIIPIHASSSSSEEGKTLSWEDFGDLVKINSKGLAYSQKSDEDSSDSDEEDLQIATDEARREKNPGIASCKINLLQLVAKTKDVFDILNNNPPRLDSAMAQLEDLECFIGSIKQKLQELSQINNEDDKI